MKTNSPSRRLLALCLGLSPLAACGGSSDGTNTTPSLTVNVSPFSVAASVQTTFNGDWAAFAADEATSGPGGTMLNPDMDVIDQVVQIVSLVTGVETNVGVAVRDFDVLGDVLYMVVDEAQDGKDWDTDGFLDDRVLLSTGLTGTIDPVYLTVLREDTGDDLIRAGEWLFVNQRDIAIMANTSTAWGIHVSTPNTLHQVMTNDAVGGLAPKLIGSEDELVFLALDETLHGRDLNGDTDTDDENVLALLDGRGMVVMGGYEFALRNTQQAMPDSTYPLRALSTGMHDWQVGFVVDETGQGMVNLNNPASADAGLPASWEPIHCTGVGMADTDTDDQILQVIHFRAWDDDPVLSPPLNTGLICNRRIVMQPGWIGTVSEEMQQGACDLNADGDFDDFVFRWTATSSPVLPPGTAGDYFAVADLEGGLHGAGELDDAFVIAVDELADDQDLNNDGFLDGKVVQWLEPSLGTPWTLDHGASATSYASARWMGPSSDNSRLGVAYAEISNGVDLNNDGDILDSVATFAQFTGSPRRLAFPGYASAVQDENAGISFQYGWAYYRISEAEDNRDWNGDGVLDDLVMLRARLADGLSQYIFELNSLTSPAVLPEEIGSTPGGLFVVQESMAGDVNGDGRISFALIYYRN